MRSFIIWGCLVWIGATVSFRWFGGWLIQPANPGWMILFYLLTIPIVAAITLPLYRGKRAAGLNLPAAAAAIAVPGMLLDIISLNWYSSLFPSMPAASVPAFAAWLMWAYGLILLSGWAGIRRRQSSQ
ncbi:DUF5367 domain-containing protein [Paenibacillus dendritiformis]|uniref:DUF5367 family protein n=1 Tax=Paenibacillus dendritiformis TaxID=130049 RepID=UPI00143DDE2D|nr:DUF5367 family protein [Paenibacillus dendritiformis]NKI20998.1 DUF5367 domain-containing protein [Paenibacillus dendritiformis]NRF98862.1 DUF5367 family protein [Paenibacillus dendritiformis]